MKKFISALLVVMMLVSMIPATVFAAETATDTLSFASTAQRVSQDGNKQVWKNAGITFTNNKASSSTNVANYYGPVRLYQGSNIVVEHTGNMTQIVFTCSSSTYASDLKNSIGSAATASGTTVTVTVAPAAQSFTVAKLTKQVRISSMTVTYEVGGSSCDHANIVELDDAVAPTCTAEGKTATQVCEACGETMKVSEPIAKLPHTYVDGACEDCGKDAPATYTMITDIAELKPGNQVVIVAAGFNTALGSTQNNNNRSVAVVEKSEDGTVVTFEEGVQLLTVEEGSEEGTFSFYTGEGYLHAVAGSNNYLRTKADKDATSSWTIEIAETGVATIKAADTSLERNWIRYNDYNNIFSCYAKDQNDVAIFKLTVVSGGDGEECDHIGFETYEGNDYVAPTCTTVGWTASVYCSNCDALVKEPEQLPISHEGFDTYTEDYIPATCTEPGETGITYCSNCDEIVAENEVIPATGHNYEGGTCTGCGDTIAVKAEATYVFASYTAGTQYAENEEHVLDDTVTMYTTQAHFTTQLRLYSSSTNNGYAIIQSQLPIKGISVNAGNKADTLQIFGSNDNGATWTLAAEISVTSTSYKDYSASLASTPYTWLKLDVKGSNQVRIAKMTLQFVTTSSGDCDHSLTQTIAGSAATCTTAGQEDTLTCACGQNVQEGAVIPALGHSYADDYCAACNSINPEAAKQAEAIDGLPQDGDVVIFYHPNAKVAMGLANGDRMGGVNVTKASGLIPYSATATAVMTVEQVGDYFRFQMNGQYLTSGATGNTLGFAALPAEGETDYTLWDVTADSSYGVFIRSVNAAYNGKANQSIEYYNGKFYPYGFNGTDYITSYRIQIGLVSRKPAVVEMGGVGYTSFEEAYAYDPDTTIKLLTDFEEINVSGDLYLDLNGFTVGSATANAIFAGDSSATATTAGTGKLTTTSEVIVDNKIGDVRYIALQDWEGAYTFHVLQLKLTNVTLRTNKAGIYYKAEMVCDEVLAGQIDCHGVAVSIVGAPTADFENEANTAATKIYGAPESVFTSGSVTNIFREDLTAEKNAARGEMAIYADSYIKLYDGTVLMGENDAANSLKDIMDYLNTNYATLSAEDQANALAFYETWADSMASWNLANLAAAILPEAPKEEQA